MLYLLAIIFPPLAILLCGKPITAMLNVLLWLCFLVPGIIHGLLVVSSHLADKRAKKIAKATDRQTRAIVGAVSKAK